MSELRSIEWNAFNSYFYNEDAGKAYKPLKIDVAWKESAPLKECHPQVGNNSTDVPVLPS